jgi:hypothetical protein
LKKNLKIARKRKTTPAQINSKRAKVSEKESPCELGSISLRNGKKTSSISAAPNKSKTPLKSLKKSKSSKETGKCTPIPQKEKSTDMHNSATVSEEPLSNACAEDLLLANSIPPSLENTGKTGDLQISHEELCLKEKDESKEAQEEVQQLKSSQENCGDVDAELSDGTQSLDDDEEQEVSDQIFILTLWYFIYFYFRDVL